MLTTMPASCRRVSWFGVTVSAATVLIMLGKCWRASTSSIRSASFIGRMSAGSCAPLRATLRCGPSRCRPRKHRTPFCAAALAAAIAAVITAGVLVFLVGLLVVVLLCVLVLLLVLFVGW